MKKILIILHTLSLTAMACGGGGGDGNGGNNPENPSTSDCNFNIEDFLNGSDAVSSNSHWSCSDSGGPYTLAIYADGTGTAVSEQFGALSLTWKETGCAAVEMTSALDGETSSITNISGKAITQVSFTMDGSVLNECTLVESSDSESSNTDNSNTGDSNTNNSNQSTPVFDHVSHDEFVVYQDYSLYAGEYVLDTDTCPDGIFRGISRETMDIEEIVGRYVTFAWRYGGDELYSGNEATQPYFDGMDALSYNNNYGEYWCTLLINSRYVAWEKYEDFASFHCVTKKGESCDAQYGRVNNLATQSP